MRFSILLWGALAAAFSGYANANDITPDDVSAIVSTLASDDMAGRRAGEEGAAAARAWLKNWLVQEGFAPAGANDSFEQTFAEGINVIAMSQADQAPKIILSAHYDHTGTHCRAHPAALSNICNGAADNATGVALALLVAKQLKATSNVPFAITLWDAEEMGLKGSRHFAKEPTFDMKSVNLMVNFDIIGLNLFKGFESNHFVIGAETGGEALQNDVLAATQGADTRFHNMSYAFGHLRSDMSSFVLAGHKMPFVFFSDGDGSVYHTTADEVQHVNYVKAADVANAATRLAATALNKTDKYKYKTPGLVLGFSLPKFTDVAPILQAIDVALQYAADNQLSDAAVARLREHQAKLQKIQQGGKLKFGIIDKKTLGEIAQELLALSAGLTIIP